MFSVTEKKIGEIRYECATDDPYYFRIVQKVIGILFIACLDLIKFFYFLLSCFVAVFPGFDFLNFCSCWCYLSFLSLIADILRL